jgi:hypothetical protein
MTQGNETPGIGGVSGASGRTVRAPAAWQRLLHVQFVTVPQTLARSKRARARLDKLGRRPGRR